MIEMFDKKNNIINDGYSLHYDFNYDRKKVKCSNFRIKEWDFLNFSSGEYIFQFIVAHVLNFDNYYAGVINIKTNQRHYVSILKPHSKKHKMIINPEENYDITYNRKNFKLHECLNNGFHNIEFEGIDQNKEHFSASVSFKSIYDANKITILHKFEESDKMFYLNYKENYFDCNLIINSKSINVKDNNAFGLIDHGRGYWPYKSIWYWSNTSFKVDDIRIGWNLGHGFGNSKIKENIIYYNDKSYKIGNINIGVEKSNPMKGYNVDEENGLLHLEFEPFFDNYSKMRILFLNKWCHQVFHYTKGYIIVDNKKIEFNNVINFLEFEHNFW